jgi:hypothetical protein
MQVYKPVGILSLLKLGFGFRAAFRSFGSCSEGLAKGAGSEWTPPLPFLGSPHTCLAWELAAGQKKKRSLSTPSSQNATLVLTTPHFSLQHVSWECLVSHRMWHSTRFFPYSVANLELSTGCTASMIYHVLGLAVRTAVCRIMRNAG